jgi:hypothetical protein
MPCVANYPRSCGNENFRIPLIQVCSGEFKRCDNIERCGIVYAKTEIQTLYKQGLGVLASNLRMFTCPW